MQGRPMTSSACSASSVLWASIERGVSSPIFFMASRKQLAVLGLVDGLGGGADHLDVELVEHAHLAERQRAVERGLAAHGGQQRKPPAASARSFSMILATISGVIGSI
jgi:hypothetical protein